MEEVVASPGPRCYCNMVALPSGELAMFGGEFWDGKNTYMYNDMIVFNVEKREWKKISWPNAPPRRSSHQTVVWRDQVFAGEFAHKDQFFHYKDL